MAKKRKLSAKIAPETQAEDISAPTPKMGGMWAGSAMNLLQKRIEDTHGSLVDGILNGTVALSLSPDQIVDEAGSDRIGAWDQDEAFAALKANIERRGQSQPIRVRPRQADWAPNPEAPFATDAQFVVQSGRRRIEACRQLGRPVLAILSTDAGDAALADLEERFHENTMRQNLSGFEELLSVGLLAESLSDLTQIEIAERLGVSQNDVSLGLSCVEMRDQIIDAVDIAKTPKRAFRALVPKLRKGIVQAPEKPKGVTVTEAGISVDIKPSAAGLTVKATGPGLSKAASRALARDLAKLLGKHSRTDG